MMEGVEDELKTRFESAVELTASNPEKALGLFVAILNEGWVVGESGLEKYQEQSIFKICALYAQLCKTSELTGLLKKLRPNFGNIPKAKTAKIVRTVIDFMGKIPGTEKEQVVLCNEYIEWCKKERRGFLRQRIQTRLCGLYLGSGRFKDALQLLADLQYEVKKLDDKQLLVEIFLIESRTHHALLNVAKAKASLTAARSNANAIYVGPLLQGEIDMQGGILNADEKDFRTGYSYFFEAFEAFTTLGDDRAILCLKYMLLCKIMNGQGNEVPGILNSKNGLKFSGRSIDAMRAVATAYKERSLHEFDDCLEDYRDQVVNDKLMQRHLVDLQGELLEQNLCRIIEPYSRVEISRVAKLIELPQDRVETKLSQMILDKKFRGILDQGAGELIVYDDAVTDETYGNSLKTLSSMGDVVDSLFRRAHKLST